MVLLRSLLSALLIGFLPHVNAAPAAAPEPDWEAQIRQAEAAMWVASNTCDMALLARTLTDDVEFYHDFVGVTTGNANFIELMKRSYCKSPSRKVRREPINDTIRVSVLSKVEDGKFVVYGGLIQGKHKFRASADGGPEEDSSTGMFFLTLLLTKDGWKIARMVSYDHASKKSSK